MSKMRHVSAYFFPRFSFFLPKLHPPFFMDQAYPYTRQYAYQYTFVSDGKERIEKVVIFSSTPIPNLYNMGFGDLAADGSIDDHIRSNNGDLISVMATVIQILKAFLETHPAATVFFIGSTLNRTALYRRILKTYYQIFSNEFIISALIEEKNHLKEVPFDPASTQEHPGFFVKKIV